MLPGTAVAGDVVLGWLGPRSGDGFLEGVRVPDFPAIEPGTRPQRSDPPADERTDEDRAADTNGDGLLDAQDISLCSRNSASTRKDTRKTWRRAIKRFYKAELRDAMWTFDERSHKTARKFLLSIVTRER